MKKHKNAKPTAPATTDQAAPMADGPGKKTTWCILGATLVLAVSLRMVNLGQSPPGLNQDEAASAWNSWCLLKTGQDQMGQPWPIFSSRCLGENRSPFFMYFLMPFLAVGGLTVPAMRMASAVAGVASVLLGYYVGRRMFGRWCGLAAAILMAVDPWSVEQSRWAHDAAIQPLVVLGTLACMLWANLPLDDQSDRKPRVLISLLAGLITGVSCYLYPSTRLFLPAMLLLSTAAAWRAWLGMLKTRRGLLAAAAFGLGVALTFGPLAWKHLTDEGMNKRGKTTAVWDPTDSFGTRMEKVLDRYPGHYGPDFLFERGDTYPVNHFQGWGQLHWYMLPLMLGGLAVLVMRCRKSLAARVLLVWLLVYPVGDILGQHKLGDGMHALRSMPGLPGLILLGAVGAAVGGAWLWHNKRAVFLPVAAAVGILFVALNAWFYCNFFGEYNRIPLIYHRYHVDVLNACEWLRPRLKDADGLFVTTQVVNQPWLITLVGLQYDPKQWLTDSHEVVTDEPSAWAKLPRASTLPGKMEWDIHLSYGKLFFMYGDWWKGALERLGKAHPGGKAYVMIRPGELQMETPPVYQVVGPEGKPVLQVFEVRL